MRPVRGMARLLLGGVFVAGGARALASSDWPTHRARMSDLPAPSAPDRADPRWPLEAGTLVRLHGAVQLGAGLLLAGGYLRRPAAAVLAASLIPAMTAEQAFWSCDEPGERHHRQMHFLKNLGLLGGLLLAAADTEGKPSVGWRTRQLLRRRHANPRTTQAR